MTARDTYNATAGTSATPTTAGAVRVASNIANAATHQESINGTISNAGKNLARGVSAADDVTIRNANATYIANKQRASMLEQVAISNAKATLRNTGDVLPA